MREKISINEISKKGPSRIIDDISNAHYSLLRSLGFGHYNLIYFWVRIVCWCFLRLARHRSKRYHGLRRSIAFRNSLGTIVSRVMPFVIDDPDALPILEKRDERKYLDCGLVIGFNHPTLGDMVRLMAICMLGFDLKHYLFPVDIVWYEALVPLLEKLTAYGLTLAPIITPSTKEVLKRHCDDDLVDNLAFGFSQAYAALSEDFIRDKQVVVAAPNVDMKLHNVDHAVLPIAVIPPRYCSKGLNPLRRYQFSPCEVLEAEDSEEFELSYLDKIKEMLESYGVNSTTVGPN